MSVAIEILQGVIFDCKFSFQTVAIIETVYTCTATVRSSDSGLTLEDVEGNHLEGNQENVEFLEFAHQDLTFIPRGIEKFFPNLKCISYYYTNLATISSEDLEPFPQLVLFFVWYGDLISLDGNLFQHNLNLQWIAFGGNKIKHVGHNLLGQLSQLQHVSFKGNVCVNQNADSVEEIRELNEQLPILCPKCYDEIILHCKRGNTDYHLRLILVILVSVLITLIVFLIIFKCLRDKSDPINVTLFERKS